MKWNLVGLVIEENFFLNSVYDIMFSTSNIDIKGNYYNNIILPKITVKKLFQFRSNFYHTFILMHLTSLFFFLKIIYQPTNRPLSIFGSASNDPHILQFETNK